MSSGAINEDPRLAVVGTYRTIDELIPRDWTHDFVAANGIRQAYYRTGGDGPVVVLLHGVMEGALEWLRVARALASHYDVIMLDARGHGMSSAYGGDFTLPTLARDVIEAIRVLVVQPVFLIGFSQGAATAALVAELEPALVRAVVLAGLPSPPTSAEGPTQANPMDSPGYVAWYNSYLQWLADLKQLDSRLRLAAGLRQYPPDAPLAEEIDYVAAVENAAALDPDLVRAGRELWSLAPETSALARAAVAQMQMPCLILRSGAGPFSSGPLELSEEPSDRGNIRIVRFGNTGHVILRDRYDAFMEQVTGFLASVSD